MKSNFAIVSGFLFGIGLVVAKMTDPSKVKGFLDVAGAWDPSLLLVMVGAIAVHFTLLRIIFRRRSPLFATTFQVPKRRDIDGRLLAGAAIFGIGWGVSGVCPGPGIVDAASGSVYALIFMATMVLGVFFERRVLRKRA